MKRRISHIAVHQTAKVFGIFYGLIGLILAPMMWLASLADPEGGFPLLFAIFFPFIYAIFGYIFTAIGVALYNAVASRLGGIEFTVTPVDD